MHSWYLIGVMSVLLLVAVVIFLAPFRIKGNNWALFSALIFCVLASVTYLFWGNWSAWQSNRDAAEKETKAKAYLRTFNSPSQLAEKLKAQLQQKPNSAKGWYLLGRVYQSQLQWIEARDSFKKSLTLDAKSEATWVHLVESLWQIEDQHYTDEIRAILLQILKKFPEQPDALSMLALDAEIRKDYSAAIKYWQTLLKLMPKTSKEAAVVQQRMLKLDKAQSGF